MYPADSADLRRELINKNLRASARSREIKNLQEIINKILIPILKTFFTLFSQPELPNKSNNIAVNPKFKKVFFIILILKFIGYSVRFSPSPVFLLIKSIILSTT